MAAKDVPDRLVCEVFRDYRGSNARIEALMNRTEQCEKVVFRAIERAVRHDLIDYGVTPASGWLTDAGEALLQ